MSLKSETQTIRTIQERRHIVGDDVQIAYVASAGTDPITHARIRFERKTKQECIEAVKFFYSKYKSGMPSNFAKDMTPQELADVQLARACLNGVGLGNVTLFEVVKDYIARVGHVRRISVVDAFRLFYDSISPIQKRYRATIKSRVGQFADAFKHRAVSELTPINIKDYLDKRFGQKAPKTYNGTLGDIKAFFNWCKRRDIGYCSENPAADIRPKPEVYKEPEFVTADTVRSVFRIIENGLPKERAAPFIRFFALWFFSGIRADEIMRLRVKDVNMEEGWIRVAKPKGFQHGMAPRMFQMLPVTKAWLTAWAREPGEPDEKFIDEFVNSSYPRTILNKLAKKAGETISLPDNAGRHSFITMHVAFENNFAKTESIAGTSRTMRENHYMGLTTKKPAEEYFAVMPKQTEK